MPTEQILQIVAALEGGIPAIRKSRNRAMMAEAVLRIRQLRGILQTRAA